MVIGTHPLKTFCSSSECGHEPTTSHKYMFTLPCPLRAVTALVCLPNHITQTLLPVHTVVQHVVKSAVH